MARSRPQPHFAGIAEKNIAAVLRRRKMEEEQKSWQNKLADAITRFTGSIRFVYIHIVLYGLWIVLNLPWVPFEPKFDPTFVILAMCASVEAIFLSTFILITQNRITEMESRRADLDLQISLLAEHEITRMLSIVTLIAQKMEIEEAENPELDELKQDVRPETVLDRLEESERRLDQE